MILIEGQIEAIRTRKDRTWAITLGTQELTPDKAAKVMSVNQKLTFIAIKEDAFTPGELETMDKASTDYTHPKTPSQRLRGVLYVAYYQDNKGFDNFAKYYEHEMERIIEHYKSKLI
jgi:uncharacterized protein YeaO (DUF488 family)